MDCDSETDEALIERASRGEKNAASILVKRHARKIHAVCYRLLRSTERAEDATQETFLKIWRNAPRWKPQGAKFSTWAYKIAVNVCYDQLRKNNREAPLDAAPESIDHAPQPDDILLAQDRRILIEDAIAMLPLRQRAAIILCHYENHTNIEAAKILDVSVDALESLLARGRRRLRDLLLANKEYLTGQMSDETATRN